MILLRLICAFLFVTVGLFAEQAEQKVVLVSGATSGMGYTKTVLKIGSAFSRETSEFGREQLYIRKKAKGTFTSPEVEKALETIFQREGLSIRRIPEKHAGGKWQLRYQSVLGGNGNPEVDLNSMVAKSLLVIKCNGDCV